MNSTKGNEIENFDIRHIACLMYRVLTGSKSGDVLSIGLHCDITTREQEMNENITAERNYHVRKWNLLI